VYIHFLKLYQLLLLCRVRQIIVHISATENNVMTSIVKHIVCWCNCRKSRIFSLQYMNLCSRHVQRRQGIKHLIRVMGFLNLSPETSIIAEVEDIIPPFCNEEFNLHIFHTAIFWLKENHKSIVIVKCSKLILLLIIWLRKTQHEINICKMDARQFYLW
jgi:hypothetical protein